MLSNAYFLAKFRFDTAENEPAKFFQISVKFYKILQICHRHVRYRMFDSAQFYENEAWVGEAFAALLPARGLARADLR